MNGGDDETRTRDLCRDRNGFRTLRKRYRTVIGQSSCRADFPISALTATHRQITVAVGTTITDRPPHRSVRARLRIRLLRRMSGVEACIRIGVQNPGWWNPPVQDWGKSFPTHLCALATADQNTLP